MADHCLGVAQYIRILTFAGAVPVVLIALFIPKMISRMEKFRLTIITRAIALVLYVLIYVTGYENTGVVLVLYVLKSLFAGIGGVTSIMFVADCVEYGQFVNGERNQGIAFATKAFTNKVVVALTGAIGMFGLAAIGFIEGSGVAQSPETIEGLSK